MSLQKSVRKTSFTIQHADKTRIPIAVDLTNTKVKTDTDLTLESPCYGVVVSAKNPENAIAFIRYAFDL